MTSRIVWIVQGKFFEDRLAKLLVGDASRNYITEELDGDLEIQRDSSLHIDDAVQELLFPLKLLIYLGR